MKRKNTSNISKESSDNEEKLSKDEFDMEEDKVDGGDDEDALDASATDSDKDETQELSENELDMEEYKTEIDDDNEAEGPNDGGDDDDALDATATDSEEDESDADEELEDNQKHMPLAKSKSEIIKDEVWQKYRNLQGKQLFIRFPHKLPQTQESLEEKIKTISPLVVKVRKPRQRYVRHCIVDYKTNEDRNIALKEIKKAIKKGDLAKYVVNKPRTESTDFVNELVERKIKSMENKNTKALLKKASKKAFKEKGYTSTVVVPNLPKTASVLQIRELFSNAVDIQIKPCKYNIDKSIAAITLPTTMDARKAIKQKLSLGGNQLVIKFDNQRFKKKKTDEDFKNTTIEEDINSESGTKIKKAKLEPTDVAIKNSGKLSKIFLQQKVNSNEITKVKKSIVKNKHKIVKK